MKGDIIRFSSLSKKFREFNVLKNVTLSVDHGEVFCLLGPNGSGKTTMINCLLSLLNPESGSIEVFGSENIQEGKRRIGVLLEDDGFYRDMNAENNLKVICLIKGADFSSIPEILKKFGLYEHRKKKVNKLSQGMRKRLALASSLIGDPELIIWDEPYNGLDASGFNFLRGLIKELNEKGKTLFISTHLLSEVEKTSSKIGLIFQGEMKETLTINEIIKKYESIEGFYFNHIKNSY